MRKDGARGRGIERHGYIFAAAKQLRLIEESGAARHAILAAEQPRLRVYAVDPGDMRTQMQQDAFPGEDISDRPPPEDSVPGLRALIDGTLASGRYRASETAASVQP